MSGFMAGIPDPWGIAPEMQPKFDEQFYQLKPLNGLVTGDQAKGLFLQSGLPPTILAQIWSLADINADGKINRHEFSVAMHLIHMKMKGYEVPKVLPPSLLNAPSSSIMGGYGVPPGPPVVQQGVPSVPPGGIPVLPVGMGPPTLRSQQSLIGNPGLMRSSSPVDAKVKRSGSISSQDSPTAVSGVVVAALTEWAIPQQSRLKHTQLFNSLDRTRTGFLMGVQARNILIQSGLPQNILAQIWNLADIDSDGRLGCEEFILAMHLVESVKAGDPLPTSLPPELHPPSFRQRARSSSVVSVGSSSGNQNLLGEVSDPKEEERLKLLAMNSFEDKRRENFEKGQAELERRRQALLASQKKEQEEREKKEREELEKRERIRLEQEKRRQLELEKQLAKQRELEQEKEEQRRKALEQREAARREMERQRQLEWERQRLQELMSQRQKEQDSVSQLKKRKKTIMLDLEQLSNKINDLTQQIMDTRQGVADLKSSIDDMRTKRDMKMAELNNMKLQMKEINERLLIVGQEKANLTTQLKPSTNNPTADSFNSVMYSLNNKEITLSQLQNTLANIEKETAQKMQDAENNNAQLQNLKGELSALMREHEKLFEEYEQKRQQILVLKRQKESEKAKLAEWAPNDDWGDSGNVTVTATAIIPKTVQTSEGTKFIRYRALYAFEARNPDELSIMPGDIILVPEGQSTEPGWLGGELQGKTGWFPDAYAEPIDGAPSAADSLFTSNLPSANVEAAETVIIVGMEMKRTLEGISEAPENGSDMGSIYEEPQTTMEVPELNSGISISESASPIPGQGQTAPEGLQAQALFPWKAKKDNQISFNKGDIILIKEQQDMWWLGEANGVDGWFPKSYVKLISGPNKSIKEIAEIQDFPDSVQETEVDGVSNSSTGSYFVSAYNYQSQEPGDLCFQQGDLIWVIKQEGEWWTGTIGNNTGIFPSNYVRPAEQVEIQEIGLTQSATVKEEEEQEFKAEENEVNEELSGMPSVMALDEPDRSVSPAMDSPRPKNTKTLKKPEIVTVIAPYNSTGPEQLTLERGQLIQVRKKSQSGWWEGELQAKGRKRQLGWFPASYVKALGGSSCSSARSTPDPVLQMQKQSEDVNGTATPTNTSEKAVALYPFKSQHEDELSFEKGQVLMVLSKDDAAWWRGTLDGRSGLFPANYVEILNDNPPAITQWVGDLKMLGCLSNEEKKRQGHIHELISTEEAYMADMSIVLEIFYKPLKDSLLLTEEELKTIFVNWKELLVCNNKLLKALRVRKTMSSNGIVQMIGDILCENIEGCSKLKQYKRHELRRKAALATKNSDLDLASKLPHMSAYVRFCSCQLRAASLIQHKTENVKEFKALAKYCCRDPRTKGMPLSSFLIKPMQRITKYPLIIKKLLEYTSNSHPDYGYLEEALSLAEQLCNQVNEGVREKENADRLEWIQTHIQCDSLTEEITFNSLTNCVGSRKLLHSGTLFKVKSNKELVGFLFNDFLLLTQPLKDVGKLINVFTSERAMSSQYKIYKQPIFLNSIMVKGSSDSSPTDDTVFQVCQIEYSLALKAVNANERLLWVKKMEEAAREYIETEKNNFTRQHSLRSQKSAGVGRLLVVVMDGINLKGCTHVRQRPSVGKLQVVVVEAWELLSNVQKGRSDPYCEVNMGSQEHRTKVIPNTTNPKWNASMQFLVKDLQRDVLCISVFDRDLFSPNNFLGRTEIGVAEIYKATRETKGPISKRLLLYEVETGEVELKLDLHIFET